MFQINWKHHWQWRTWNGITSTCITKHCRWNNRQVILVQPKKLDTSFIANALSFYVTKTVLVGPKRFWSDQIDLDLTIMIWSRPKWNGQVQIVIFYQIWITFGPDQLILVVTISFWSWPNHYGQVWINLVRPKPFWTDQNCFGHIEGQGIKEFFRTIFWEKTQNDAVIRRIFYNKTTYFKFHFQMSKLEWWTMWQPCFIKNLEFSNSSSSIVSWPSFASIILVEEN